MPHSFESFTHSFESFTTKRLQKLSLYQEQSKMWAVSYLSRQKKTIACWLLTVTKEDYSLLATIASWLLAATKEDYSFLVIYHDQRIRSVGSMPHPRTTIVSKLPFANFLLIFNVLPYCLGILMIFLPKFPKHL
jgi:hypothetical protein